MANNDRPRSIRFYLNDPLDASLEEFMATIGQKNFTSYVKERIFEHLMEMTENKFRNPYTSKGVQATLAINYLKDLQTLDGIDMVTKPEVQPASVPTAKPPRRPARPDAQPAPADNPPGNTDAVQEQSTAPENMGGQPEPTPTPTPTPTPAPTPEPAPEFVPEPASEEEDELVDDRDVSAAAFFDTFGTGLKKNK